MGDEVGARAALDVDQAEERRSNEHVDFARTQLSKWRSGGHQGVTSTTRRLLEHWTRVDRDRRLFFCQLEAAEAAIYLGEIAPERDERLLDTKNIVVEVTGERRPEKAAKVATARNLWAPAFYLGDLRGIKKAYPAADMSTAGRYEPDSICGTWELFSRVVDDDGGNKAQWAEAMGRVMTTNPSESRSPSFRALCRALRRLATPVTASRRKARKWVHVAKQRKHTRER